MTLGCMLAAECTWNWTQVLPGLNAGLQRGAEVLICLHHSMQGEIVLSGKAARYIPKQVRTCREPLESRMLLEKSGLDLPSSGVLVPPASYMGLRCPSLSAE